jgi:hypothetical protein
MKPLLAVLLLAAATARAAVVTNTLASGPGSLRQVFEDHLRFNTGTITFAPELSGQTINPGELYIGSTFDVHPTVTSTVVIDGSGVPGGVTISYSLFTAPFGAGLTLRNLTVSGGSIRSLGILELTGCTFTGTGVSTEMGTASMTRCTFTGNSGTAISNPYTGNVTLTHCTVSGNGTGLSNGYRYSVMKVVNCIIAGNASDVSNLRYFTREGANIIPKFSGASTPYDPINNPYPPVDGGPPAITSDPLLAPLGDYGGPTQTMALLPGSPARDASVGSSGGSDQRGFPVVGTPDIGAYEAGAPANYNAWTVEAFPATATPAQRAAEFDFDGDGQSNGDEFNYLTDPLSAASFFAPRASIQGGSLSISFATASGRAYTLQQNSTLVPAAWANAPGQSPINGDGTVKSFTVPASVSRQFFRVMGAP